ncbi:hypothetical protein PINS_up005894 [Pythium insidiosum]|nr:hypothetical protein PINS_up005894 [Pythium insidiosum]
MAKDEARISMVEEGLDKNDYVGVQEEPKPASGVSPLTRECLAEFFGTFVMMCFGLGVNSQVVVSALGNGIYLSINICWGIAVMMGIHVAGGVSGAHLNPAVSFALAVFKRFPAYKFLPYVVAQMLGSFCAAVCIYILNYQNYNAFDPDRTKTGGLWGTLPNPNVNTFAQMYTEFFATAMLMVGVFCLGDSANKPASSTGVPVHFMYLIWGIGMAFGWNTGYALNPARDFAPRLFTWMAGWGSAVFTKGPYYFWIPIVMPMVGGVVGGGLYKLFIENHHPKQN